MPFPAEQVRTKDVSWLGITEDRNKSLLRLYGKWSSMFTGLWHQESTIESIDERTIQYSHCTFKSGTATSSSFEDVTEGHWCGMAYIVHVNYDSLPEGLREIHVR